MWQKRVYTSLSYRFSLLYSYFFYKKNFSKSQLHVRRNDSDLRVFKQIFIEEVYNFLPSNFKVEVIIDAGANVGYSAYWFKEKFPNSMVIAIEPESNNFSMLEKNVKNLHNVFTIKKGVWNTNTKLTLSNPDNLSWAFVTTESTSNNIMHEIDTITVNEILSKYDIKFIDIFKIDIEGSEMELFSANNEWIHKVKYFMIETHERLRPGVVKVIDGLLLSSGFQKFQTKELDIYLNVMLMRGNEGK